MCACGRAKENRGPKARQLVSAVGVVSIRRRYWQCRCGANGGSYAADVMLGLDGRLSRTVQKHACRLGADGAFAAAREHLKEMLSVRVSAETIRRVCQGHGKAMARFQRADAATAAAFRRAAGAVEFAVDAGKGNTREEGWKDLTGPAPPENLVAPRLLIGESVH